MAAELEDEVNVVVLQCVRDRGKLRIRFKQCIDHSGRVYYNSYDNNYNCRFPRGIRVEGRLYKIPCNDISLVKRGKQREFYHIKTKNITVLNEKAKDPMKNVKIYDAGKCVICMEAPSEKINLPCGHKCACDACSIQVQRTTNTCPLCRRIIESVMDA